MLSRIKFEKRPPKMGGLLLCQTEKLSGTAINAPRSEDGRFLVCILQWIKCAQRPFYGVLRRVKFCAKNEDIHQLLSNGVQFPKAMADDILAKHSIPQDEVESNADIDTITSRRERTRYKNRRRRPCQSNQPCRQWRRRDTISGVYWSTRGR